jgi:hypothetical protein
MNAKISISVLLMVLLTSLITVMGQEQTDKKKQEEETRKKKEQITIIMDSHKDAAKDLQKAMTESLEAEEKALKSKMEKGLLDSKTYWKESQALQEYKKQLGELKVHPEINDPAINYSFTPSMKYRLGENAFSGIYNLYGGEREGTSLSISKSLEDVTISTDFFYDVKEESSNVNFFVTGTLKAGELKITLKKPDKTSFQEITISPLADVNWNQQFRWDEDESDEYLGKWIISISANKANGTYRVQVNSR